MCNPEGEEYRKRWLTPGGRELTARVVKVLRGGGDFRRLGPIEIVDGRWDLRGISFPMAETIGAVEAEKLVFGLVRGRLILKRINVIDCNLSYSDLGDSVWEWSEFRNVIFAHANCSNSNFWACSFSRVSFDHADLRSANFTELGNNPVVFRSCSFKRTRFNKLVGGFNIFADCKFDHANLRSVDFDGSRFQRCEFIGPVNDTMFHKHARILATPMFRWLAPDPKQFINTMEDVDFSSATLHTVTFDAVDLTHCVFPVDDNHFLVKNQHPVFEHAYEIISSKWKCENCETILRILDAIYITPAPHSPLTDAQTRSPVTLINRMDYIDWFGEEAGNRTFELIKQLSNHSTT